jgi:hypothetical protein
MIDFTELIKAQRKGRGIVTRKKKQIDEITNRRTSIEEAKAKVEEILNSDINKKKRGVSL